MTQEFGYSGRAKQQADTPEFYAVLDNRTNGDPHAVNAILRGMIVTFVDEDKGIALIRAPETVVLRSRTVAQSMLNVVSSRLDDLEIATAPTLGELAVKLAPAP